MKIISVFGASGAGKGTVATMLTMLDDRLHHSKFARPMKRELEESFALSERLLEHRCMKSMPTFQRGSETFLDLMVKRYHERKGDSEVPEETKRLLSQCQAYGLVPVFDDCRNAREADLLACHEIYGLWVSSRRGTELSSDRLQWDIWKSCDKKQMLDNDHTMLSLFKSVHELYQGKLSRWLNT
jgi:hypothetical protein